MEQLEKVQTYSLTLTVHYTLENLCTEDWPSLL